MMTSSLIYLLGLMVVCNAQYEEFEADEEGGASVTRYAECVVDDSGSGVTGYVDFRQTFPQYLEVRVNLTGFNAVDTNLKHGFHVHTYGTIRQGCGGAGGHFNPTNVPHGAPNSTTRHVGDFGNIVENGMGQVMTSFVDHIATLLPSDANILGRAIVIHARADDLGQGGTAASAASGDAGPRIGCCVIVASSGSNRWPLNTAPVTPPPSHEIEV